MRKKRNKGSNKAILGVIISVCALGAIYLGISLYSINHFHFGTIIDGVSVGGQTVDGAKEKLSSQVQAYTLELKERGDLKEQIKATDIGLKYDADKIKEIKDNQNPFSWPLSLFKKTNSEESQIIMYDEEQLNQTLNSLSCVNNKKVVQPQNASLNYEDGEYVIVDEVLGNRINKDALYDNISSAILSGESSIDLDSSNCYENPKYTSKSEEVATAKETLNKYVSLKITYDSNGKTEILDGSVIHNWLGVDENMAVTINEDKVRSYVYKISSIYNTFGNTRDFLTTSKKTVQVSGGNYGWIVNNSKEVKDLIEIVKNGQDVTKEPAYSQSAFIKGTDDIGNTYVEIDVTKQHLWFYKNGVLIIDDDVVTGNVSNNTGTPTGTYVLNYKEKNATLKGEDYSSAVDYWMPFNGNIGIHDASWRNGEFGNHIYLTNGSHGCVNSPYNLAKTIFENIEAGTPIIVYNE